MVCPNCGSTHIHTDTHTVTKGKEYDGCLACIGVLLFQWIGLLCGFCGSGTKTVSKTHHICQDCGKQF